MPEAISPICIHPPENCRHPPHKPGERQEASSDLLLRPPLEGLHQFQPAADCPIAPLGRPLPRAWRASSHPCFEFMLCYIFVFFTLVVLGVMACVAASAADAPAVGQVAFAVSLGLFVAALAGGVTRSHTQQHK